MGQKKGQGAGPRDGESSIRGRGIEENTGWKKDKVTELREFLGGRENDRDGERRIGAEGQKETGRRTRSRTQIVRQGQ